MSPRLYAANFEANVGAATSPTHEVRLAKEIGFKETWLQQAIAQEPRLVLDACLEAELVDDELWFAWAREVEVEGGSIDVLLVSESGRVAIVETKLAYNPEKRRSVLAQVLEYAVNLPRLPIEKLPSLPAEAKKIGLRLERVHAQLQEGNLLLVVAGDQLDSRAVRLGKALLGHHLTRGWTLAMVEVAVFERTDMKVEPRYLLVPHLRGTIVPEVRQVLKVQVSGARLDGVAVEQPVPTDPTQSGEKWTEDRFIAALDASALSPAYKAYARDLLRLRSEFDGLQVRWGRGKTGSLTIKRNGHGLAELYLDGTLAFRRERPPLALGPDAGKAYLEGLAEIFPETMKEPISPNYPTHVYGPVSEGKLVALVTLLRKVLQGAT